MTPYREAPRVEAMEVRVPRVGILVRFWRWLFGDPPVTCAAVERSADLLRDFARCEALPDRRCLGGNCTSHCTHLCGERCEDAK